MTERTSDMDHHDLRGRVVGLEHGHASHLTRLVALELWTRNRDISDARRDEQFLGIQKDLDSIKSNLSRIVWLIVSGIILGVVAFMMSGGFKVP